MPLFYDIGRRIFLAGLAGLIIRHNVMGDVDMIVEGGKYIYVDVDRVVYETSVTDENGRHPLYYIATTKISTAGASTIMY